MRFLNLWMCWLTSYWQLVYAYMYKAWFKRCVHAKRSVFLYLVYILSWEVVVSQLRAGLDVCSFLQLTPIRDKTAFFVSFNSLTKQFSIIGNTHMLTGGVGKCTCKIFEFTCEFGKLQKRVSPPGSKKIWLPFCLFLYGIVWVAIHNYSALDEPNKELLLVLVKIGLS